YGLRVRTEDIAKLGQFYLQNGEWKGRQLLPASWVEQATAKQVSNGSNPDSDWNQGYGFQFWRCRHNAFRGDGAFGQYCIVMPDLDAVIAINSGVRDMQAVLNVVWDRFLPACHASELPANPGAATRLRSKLASLEVSRAPGEPTSQLASRVVNRRYVFAANDSGMQSVELIPDDAGRTLTVSVQREGKEMRFRAGFDKWQAGRLPLSGGALAEFPDEPVAATCGWTAGDTLTIKLCAIETPFHQTWNLRFEGDQVRLDSEANVAFGSTRQLNLVGRAE
ncbi:MAG: serine hydrolase, partial [Verrucomicrobiae bacterium]|nr:serine hydrolase [Verrucomicrobiae bacterium]